MNSSAGSRPARLRLPPLPSSAASIGSFSPYRLGEIDKTISADDFQGRGVNTPAETKTVNYIVDQFRSAGLQPGGDRGERPAQMDAGRATAAVGADGRAGGHGPNGSGRITLTQGNEIAVRSPQNGAKPDRYRQCAASVRRLRRRRRPSAIGTTSRARTSAARSLSSSSTTPTSKAGEGDFGGKAMTYYGRWTYKYEEAARRGAAGVMIVHETAPASYGWATVKNTQHQHAVRHRPPESGGGHTPFETWIQRDSRSSCSRHAGLDFEARRRPPGAATSSRCRSRRPSTLRRPPSQHHHLAQRRRHPAGQEISGRDAHLLGALGPSRHRPARRQRRHIYNGAVDNAHRHRPADRAGAPLRARAAARALGRVPRRHRRGKGPARQRILRHPPALSARRRRSACLNTDSMASRGPAKNFSISRHRQARAARRR